MLDKFTCSFFVSEIFSKFIFGRQSSKILNTFSFCSQLKCWLSGLEFTKANREDPDQTALIWVSAVCLCHLGKQFWRNFITSKVAVITLVYH